MDDFFDNWTVQVRKGVLELCLLSALEGGECYGYELVKRLSATPGLSVAEGSIYPLLSRMKSAGLVGSRLEESNAGPARKYYQVTEAGRDRLRLMRPYFEALVAAVRGLQGTGADLATGPREGRGEKDEKDEKDLRDEKDLSGSKAPDAGRAIAGGVQGAALQKTAGVPESVNRPG
ncbi:MAG: PadR family transcriptional regulator [Verrucomicrobiales bacterium]|nr:PadR family transcriptional regulator [Verrucomicrobiales bacterium]